MTGIINIAISALTLLTMIVSLIYKMQGIDKRSLENIKKRFEIYKEIIINDNNEVLSYTYLKEYLGFPISDDMVKYMLKSTSFYDLVIIWKNIYSYVDYNSEANKVVYKNNRKPGIKLLIVCYFISSIPFFLFILFFSKLIHNFELLILLIILTFPFILVAIFILTEIGNRALAIKLMEKLEKKNKIAMRDVMF